ncbi:hypothetical protein [Nocardia sp. NPDC058497]|uniref:hypothetical protein n=1 Tax=Nocardia sp. NPDC058497 TaxID=3346529 RepID=UPI00365CC0CE
MSAAPGKPLAAISQDDRIEVLRARMAAIPSRVGASSRAEVHGQDVLAVPGGLGQLLPSGGLEKGSVIVCSGSSLVNGLLAAVTGAGKFAAVIGCHQLGLLSAAEMGADLSRLAHIPQPGQDRLAVLAVLLDGLELVVLDLAGETVAPSRARALDARVRSHRSVLVVTRGDWAGCDLRLETRPTAYGGLGRGHGRLQSVHLDVRVSGKRLQPRTGRLTLAGSGPHQTAWTLDPPKAEKRTRTG